MCATLQERLRMQFRAAAACVLAVALGAACSGAQSAGGSPQNALGVYKIGGDEAFPPFEYVAESGAYQGFNVDLMNAIGIELGIQIELIPMPWSHIRQALEDGDICAIQGMKRTPARELAALFNEGIAKVKSSGTYGKIHAKWFGRPIDEGFLGLHRARIRLLLTASAFILAGAMLIVAWNLALRRLVAAKTTEIAQVNALNHQILESSCDGIAAVDSELSFIWANGTAMRLMGWKHGSVVGVNLSDTLLAPLVYRTPLRRIASGEADAIRCDVELNIGDEPRICSVSLMPLMPQASSAQSGVLLAFSDVTALRHSEQAASTGLLMSALARSISGVAAAIRNPLLSIREYLGQLPDRCDQPEFIDEICRFVPSQVDSVNAAIGDLAFFANPKPPEPEAFDLAACVSEALARAGDEADSRGVIIRSHLADTKAFADEAQVADAVYRVVSNAIACSRHRSEVDVHLRIANEAFAEIEVCGYLPDLGTQRARIERAERSRMDAAAGLFFSARLGDSALGMAVAYRILQLNGGLLAAEATHEGACVKMTIPRPSK